MIRFVNIGGSGPAREELFGDSGVDRIGGAGSGQPPGRSEDGAQEKSRLLRILGSDSFPLISVLCPLVPAAGRKTTRPSRRVTGWARGQWGERVVRFRLRGSRRPTACTRRVPGVRPASGGSDKRPATCSRGQRSSGTRCCKQAGGTRESSPASLPNSLWDRHLRGGQVGFFPRHSNPTSRPHAVKSGVSVSGAF